MCALPKEVRRACSRPHDARVHPPPFCGAPTASAVCALPKEVLRACSRPHDALRTKEFDQKRATVDASLYIPDSLTARVQATSRRACAAHGLARFLPSHPTMA